MNTLGLMKMSRSPRNITERACVFEHEVRDRRVKLKMAVALELAPGFIVKAVIHDLSANGFQLRSRAVLIVGQQFIVRMPRGDMTGRVRWVDGFSCGGVFDSRVIVPSW